MPSWMDNVATKIFRRRVIARRAFMVVIFPL
jgi:hypothetical protein